MKAEEVRSRCTLHVNKVGDFMVWLIKRGWTFEGLKGDYEVLRMTKPGRKPLIVHKKLGAVHCTTWGESAVELKQWLKERRK